VKKSEQIKALQAECDRLAKERDAYRASLAQAHRQVRDLRATLARRDQSLGDRVRSEFHEKWSWLLEAVGL
jgi:peptidoglycan hydrolase CwlO-like protein